MNPARNAAPNSYDWPSWQQNGPRRYSKRQMAMPRKIDMRRIEAAHARHDVADDAFEDWEYAEIERLYAHDYDESYPVASKADTTEYAKQYRRSQQVTVGPRSTADG